MTDKIILSKIFEKIKKDPSPSFSAFDEAKALLKEIENGDFESAHSMNKEYRMLAYTAATKSDAVDREMLLDCYKWSYLFDAPFKFDDYMIYMEMDRPPQERFYLPRRKVLKPLVDAIQDLLDDKLDELFLSMPPRVGKTTILMFLMSFLNGSRPETSNLYSAFSDTITRAMYNGCLELMTDAVTYKWQEIFPESIISQTNAADETLNVGRKKRYQTFTARSLYGTLNGAVDANGFLISDDLIGGIEEALNKDRMMSAWTKVDNNLLTRAKQKCKVLWCGTRWSIVDPAGIRIDLLENDPKYATRRFKVINLPALNENDESNFDYAYGVGFDTAYYHQRRASFERHNDMESWVAQYMGQPIEREGTLFSPALMRYYNGVLPDIEPDRVFMFVDPAFGGGDFVAAPVCFMYGEDIYVHDVVYSNENKKITQPMIANAVEKYGVSAVRIEANKSTESYKEEVAKLISAKGLSISITSKMASNSTTKENRIRDKASDIMDHMIFIENGKRNNTYQKFMENVFAFKLIGKNKHDDAPDSLAGAMDMVNRKTAQIFRRPF